MHTALFVAAPAPRCPPARCVRDDVGTLADRVGLPAGLRVGTIEPRDIPDCITLLLECFYKDTLTLAEADFTEEEMLKLRPALQVVNGAFTFYNRLGLTQTTRLRLGRRLLSGGTGKMEPACSLVLAAHEADGGRMIGVAELFTQPLDGKLPGDLRMPSLPWVKREPECAYMSNLCVSASWRGRGVAKAMLRICEATAKAWGFDELYLHTATENETLLAMYEGWQYEQLPEFDQPGWVLATSGREAMRFHRRGLADVDVGGGPTVQGAAQEVGR